MDRGYARFGPSSRRRRAVSPFRTAHLNVAGWSALAAACLAAGAVGVAGAARSGRHPVTGAPAALLPVLAVLALDRRRWLELPMGVGWGGSLTEVQQVAAEINRRGGAVRVETDRHLADDLPQATLSLRGRDLRLVEQVLRERGIPASFA